jgi:hypothetical protein
MNAPDKAIVLSVAEKSQIQALDARSDSAIAAGAAGAANPRFQAPCPNHTVRRLNVLEGTVIGECHPRHGHQEFLRFPAGC